MAGVSNYKIRSGDTLSKIAARHNTTVDALVKANKLKDPNKISAGQTLKIPDGFDAKPTRPTPAPRKGAQGDRFEPGKTTSPSGSTTPSKPAANEELGGLSRKYEARGPGTVSTGKGDNGGVSYGSYQFASKNGSAKAFVNSLKSSHPEYYKALSGNAPGTKEFSAAWKQLAAKDPTGFDKAQHDYIKATHYDVGAAEIKKATGIDLSTRSHALRDVAWSTAVQHGPKAADDIFKRALKGRDPSQVSDAELIKSVYAERGRTDANGTLVYFSKSSAAVQKGVADRYKRESKDALAMLAKEGTQPAAKPATQKPATEVDLKDTTPVKPAASGPATQVKVPYYSQFEAGHGYTPSNTACFKAATAMAAAAGATVTGPGNRIQVGLSENGKGQLVVDSKKAAEGQRYIDGQLDKGKPVVVGVSHKDANYNADGLTDHFVTITGRGVDEKGRTYYTFHDPGTKNASKGQDTNPNNRFYVDDKTGNLYRPGQEANGYVTDRRYEVAMVRRNA